jgi:hypothetical protein
MRLDPLQQSNDIEDRRGSSGGIMGGGAGRIGVGGMILAAVAYFVFGINPSTTLSTVSAINSVTGGASASNAGTKGLRTEDEQGVLVSKVFQSTKDIWTQAFGGKYRAPMMVLYSGRTQTACGVGQAAAGPFYCPGDQKVYLDLSFFNELQKMGAGGDFAQAYVIAHEVGHHIQYLTGVEQKVSNMRSRLSEAQNNALSVRMELQADCYAGVWAARANASNQILEQGDIEEGLNAAHKIGDDYLQKQAQGYAVPDSFTHGSSAQRMQWFKQGLQSGDPNTCNTFAQN